MKSFNRRLFLKTSAIGAAGMVVTTKANTVQSGKDDAETNSIIKRKLGNTGIEVPVVSMGVGGCDSPAVVKAALKVGINHFDTAHRYQGGKSETMLGEVLKEYPRDSFTIATKVRTAETKEKFLEQLDISLERLQMKYVDILYLHSLKKKEDALNETMIDALITAKEQGKVKHIGLSTHKSEPEVIQAAIDRGVYEVILTALNYKQEHSLEIKEKIELAAAKGIGIVAMKVMAGGFLDKEKTKSVNYKAALKWSLQDPNVATAIPALNNIEQLQDNMPVLTDTKLTPEEKEDLKITRVEAGLYCDGCGICTNTCKYNLPVSDYMRAYMYTYSYGETKKASELVLELTGGKNPCSSCTICSAQCKKGFQIAEKINDVCRLNDVPDDFLA